MALVSSSFVEAELLAVAMASNLRAIAVAICFTSGLVSFRHLLEVTQHIHLVFIARGWEIRIALPRAISCAARVEAIALRSKRTLLGVPGLTTRNKKLLGTKGIATRSKDATRGSWPYY